MQRIKLTKNEVALVDDADYPELSGYAWQYDTLGYAVRSYYVGHGVMRIPHKTRMHRHIMLPPEDMEVDHINGNRLDNRRTNLRIVTHAQNMANMKVHRDSKSGHRGVHFRKDTGKWQAQICVLGKRYSLGSFDNIDDAVRSYKDAARLHFGEIYQG